MIQRDYILRQVHQLAQVLAEVLFRARADRNDDAQGTLADGLASALGVEFDEVVAMPREAVVALCTSGDALSGELALALATLLRASDAEGARRRALWLFEAALDSGAAVPVDIFDTLDRLRAETE